MLPVTVHQKAEAAVERFSPNRHDALAFPTQPCQSLRLTFEIFATRRERSDTLGITDVSLELW